MNANEEYLDELLKAIEPITNPEKEETESASEEPINDTLATEEPASVDYEELEDQDITDTESDTADIASENTDADIIEEETPEITADAEDVSTEEDSDSYQSMTEDEIDSLINEAKTVAPQPVSNQEEADISDLLGQYAGDEDAEDINALLQKEENREAVSEDILPVQEESLDALVESANDEIQSEEQEPRKKRKREKRQRKEKTDQSEKKDNTEKKPNIFSRILKMLTEEDDNLEDAENVVPEAGETGITDENLTILNELSSEDKKKEKKKKKAKKTKGKEEQAEGEDGEETPDKKGKKNKKEKKPPKEKKPKKEKIKEPTQKEKKLPKKRVIATFAFCLTIMAAIIIMSTVFTDIHNKAEARWAFDNEDFQTSYECLYGKKLNEEDQSIFDKSQMILSMDRKLSSYENFKKLGMGVESLNALFEGVRLHEKIADSAAQLGISDRIEAIYQNIYGKFSDFGLSDEDVNEILSYESDVTYTKRLDSIVNGTPFEEAAEPDTITATKLENVLPEEEDFLPDDNTIYQSETAVEQSQTETDSQGDEIRVGSQTDNNPDERPGTQVLDDSMNMEAPVQDGTAVLER